MTEISRPLQPWARPVIGPDEELSAGPDVDELGLVVVDGFHEEEAAVGASEDRRVRSRSFLEAIGGESGRLPPPLQDLPGSSVTLARPSQATALAFW